MKFSLSLLCLIGFVAFIAAAPAEEQDFADPKEEDTNEEAAPETQENFSDIAEQPWGEDKPKELAENEQDQANDPRRCYWHCRLTYRRYCRVCRHKGCTVFHQRGCVTYRNGRHVSHRCFWRWRRLCHNHRCFRWLCYYRKHCYVRCYGK